MEARFTKLAEQSKAVYARIADDLLMCIKHCVANSENRNLTYFSWDCETKDYYDLDFRVNAFPTVGINAPLILVFSSQLDIGAVITIYTELLNRCFNELDEVYIGVFSKKEIPNVKLVQLESDELQPFAEAGLNVATSQDKEGFYIFKSWLSQPDEPTQKESTMQTTPQAKPISLSFQLSQYNLAEQGFVAKNPSVMIEPLNEWWALMHPSILKAVTHEFPDTLYEVDAHHDNRKVFMSSCNLRSNPSKNKKVLYLYFAFDPIVQELNLFGDYEADYEVTWDFILKKLKSVPELNGMVIELTVTKDVAPYVLQKLVEMSEVRCTGSTGFPKSQSVSDTFSYRFTLKA